MKGKIKMMIIKYVVVRHNSNAIFVTDRVDKVDVATFNNYESAERFIERCCDNVDNPYYCIDKRYEIINASR